MKLSPEEQAGIDKGIQAKQQSSLATLQAIENQTPNKGDLWKKLQEDIPVASARMFKRSFKGSI